MPAAFACGPVAARCAYLNPHDLRAGWAVAVLFDARGVRQAEIFALDQPAFAEGDSQADLHRVEYEPLVAEPYTHSERGEKIVFENVRRIADQSEVCEPEYRDAEPEGLVGGEDHRFRVEDHAVGSGDVLFERLQPVVVGEADHFVAAFAPVPALRVVERQELADAAAPEQKQVREPLQVYVDGHCGATCRF